MANLWNFGSAEDPVPLQHIIGLLSSCAVKS